MAETPQRTFAKGEVSPEFYPRVELAAHAQGLKTARNFQVKKTGGAQNRPGTELVAQVAHGNAAKVRLIKFELSSAQAYLLEFGDRYVRFYKDQAQIKEPFFVGNFSITAFTNSATSAFTLAATPANPNFPPLNNAIKIKINTALNPTWASLDNKTCTLGAGSGLNSWFLLDQSGKPINTSVFAAYNAGGAPAGATLWVPGVIAWVDSTFVPGSTLLEFYSEIPDGTNDITITGSPIRQLNGNFILLKPNAGSFGGFLRTPQGAEIDSSTWGTVPLTPPGGTCQAPYQISTPLTSADLETLVPPPVYADVMFIAHANHPPMRLNSYADADWAFQYVAFGSTLNVPGVPAVVPTYANNTPPAANFPTTPTENGVSVAYYVSAVDVALQETVASPVSPLVPVYTIAGPTDFPGLQQVVVTWAASAGAAYYRIYRQTQVIGSPPGTVGLVGIAPGATFTDTGFAADSTQTPITTNINPFGSVGNFPSVSTFYQNRWMVFSTVNSPATAWASAVGDLTDFNVNALANANDSLSFTLSSNKVMTVVFALQIKPGFLMLFTDAGISAVMGDSSGTLVPGVYNVRQQNHRAVAGFGLQALAVGDTALYVQAFQNIIRDLKSEFSSNGGNNVGYDGDDLTVFSTHLFQGFTVVDWDYQDIPDSIVWAVRSDGALLSMTYQKGGEMAAWTRNDTLNGLVENVCVIPENGGNSVYLSIKRTINGQSFRYIERLTNRLLKVPEPQLNGLFERGGLVDYVGMDLAATFDGRNTGNTTMTLSAGSTWTYQDFLTITASAPFFKNYMVGDQIIIKAPDGSLLFCTITSYTSTTVVKVQVDFQGGTFLPVNCRNAPLATWAHATARFFGLYHLEGQKLSVLGNGYVVASPNNYDLDGSGARRDNYPVITVVNGQITLPKPMAVVHAGLPFLCDLESLPPDSPSGPSEVNKKKNPVKLSIWVKETAGGFMGNKLPQTWWENSTPISWGGPGDAAKKMYEVKIRDDENYQEPTRLKTGIVETNITGVWDKFGTVALRQVDPLPMTVTGMYPDGFMQQT